MDKSMFNEWNVYLPDNNGKLKLLDTVYFSFHLDRQDVKDSLIQHDNYPENIIITKQKGYNYE